MRLHRQEKAAQLAAQSSGRPVTVCWLYDEFRICVRAKKKLVGFEMRYWLQFGPGDRAQFRRDEMVRALRHQELA